MKAFLFLCLFVCIFVFVIWLDANLSHTIYDDEWYDRDAR